MRCSPAARRSSASAATPTRARSTNPTLSWHAWDAANERPPAAAFEGVDAVVNLIGENINQRLTEEAKERIRKSRGAGDEEPGRRDARHIAGHRGCS